MVGRLEKKKQSGGRGGGEQKHWLEKGKFGNEP